MQQSLSRWIIFSVFLVATVFSQISGESRPAGCAPLSDVQDALSKAQQLVAVELGPKDAAELLAILRERAITAAGMVCFLSGDFSEFGHILAQFFTNHKQNPVMETATRREDDEWQPTFNKDEMEDSGAKGCVCTTCSAGYVSWCSPSSSVAECCPDICANIFRAISVGALIGLKSSGVDACCEDGAARCQANEGDSKSMSTKPRTPPRKRENPISTVDEEPDSDFGGNSSTDEDLAEEKSNSPAPINSSAAVATSPKPTPSASSKPSPSPERIGPKKRSHEVVFSIAGNSGMLIFNTQELQVGTLAEEEKSPVALGAGAASEMKGGTPLEVTDPVDAVPPNQFQTNAETIDTLEKGSPFAALDSDRRPSPTPAELTALGDDSDSRAVLERPPGSTNQGTTPKESDQRIGSERGASERKDANPASHPDSNSVTGVMQAIGSSFVSDQPFISGTTEETPSPLLADSNPDSANSASSAFSPVPLFDVDPSQNGQLTPQMSASTSSISATPEAPSPSIITSTPHAGLSKVSSDEEEGDLFEESTTEPSMMPLG